MEAKDLTATIADINNKLVDDGITNHMHRMEWLACAMAAQRFGGSVLAETPTNDAIARVLHETDTGHEQTTEQLRTLADIFDDIRYNGETPEDVADLLKKAADVRAFLNSPDWRGEDVFQIMYEIIAVKQKSARGQVFTPAHIGQLMAAVLDVHEGDHVLDAACGTGSLLLKCYAAGVMSQDLYGVEWDREMFALCVANILAHNDGIAHVKLGDSKTSEVADWIRAADISKTIMNPPYENKYGCPDIVGNVLEAVPDNTRVAMLLPDKKLEKFTKRKRERITKRAVLDAVVKLPKDLFEPLASVSVSLFIWETGTPQEDRSYAAMCMEDDGFTTYKNSVRIDTQGKWPERCAYWVDIIRNDKYDKAGGCLQSATDGLSYKEPEKPFVIYDEDFKKAAFDYLLFEMRENAIKAGTYTKPEKPLTISDIMVSGAFIPNPEFPHKLPACSMAPYAIRMLEVEDYYGGKHMEPVKIGDEPHMRPVRGDG